MFGLLALGFAIVVAVRVIAPAPKVILAPGDLLVFALHTRGTATGLPTQGVAELLESTFSLSSAKLTQDPTQGGVWRGQAVYHGAAPRAVSSSPTVLWMSLAKG